MKPMSSKPRIRDPLAQVVLKTFVDKLEDYIALWQREAPEKTFEDFLLEAPQDGLKLKRTEKALFSRLQRVVAVQVELWRLAETEKPFHDYLREVKARLNAK